MNSECNWYWSSVPNLNKCWLMWAHLEWTGMNWNDLEWLGMTWNKLEWTELSKLWSIETLKFWNIGPFWRLIMLIMQKWDFSGTLNLLQMLLPILYLHNMRYRTDPVTQTRKKWRRIRKVSIFDFFVKNSKSQVTWPHNGKKTFFAFFNSKRKKSKNRKKKIFFEKFRFLKKKILTSNGPKIDKMAYKSSGSVFPGMVSIEKL